jgi:A/G-specific adenine glycosylase
MTKKDIVFIECVRVFYSRAGRHLLPWRKTHNPYRILVSEIMLQQTQVERVIPKFKSFLKRFPTVQALAAASLGEVLTEWQGLGYNRRAKMLQRAAQVIVEEYNGRWPKTYTELLRLPGVGPYTAGAISAFAFNTPIPLIETNIRTVYLHHYYPGKGGVTDAELFPIITRTLDQENPREWYAALMDYGSYLKMTVGNVSRFSRHHSVQKTFKGSDREIRGAVIKTLTGTASMTESALLNVLSEFEPARVRAQVAKLSQEEMVRQVRGRYALPT